jgi:hypothetical protein
MDRWSVQYRSVAVELFIKTESVTATQRGFRQQIRRPNALSPRPRLAPTPGNVERVRDAILRSRNMSAQR